jgi:two-component system response regulator
LEKVILLVEDSADDEALLLRALDKSGLRAQAVVFRNGKDALDFIFGRQPFTDRSRQQWIMAALIDLKMSGVDGLEILRRIRESDALKALPVVILTSSDEEKDMLVAYQLGASSYIRKTTDFTQFSRDLQRVFDYWLNLNLVPQTISAETSVS